MIHYSHTLIAAVVLWWQGHLQQISDVRDDLKLSQKFEVSGRHVANLSSVTRDICPINPAACVL
jgi:hypothetical protein